MADLLRNADRSVLTDLDRPTIERRTRVRLMNGAERLRLLRDSLAPIAMALRFTCPTNSTGLRRM